MAGVGIEIILTLIVQRVPVAQKEEGSHPSSLREEGDKGGNRRHYAWDLL